MEVDVLKEHTYPTNLSGTPVTVKLPFPVNLFSKLRHVNIVSKGLTTTVG